MCGVSLGYHFFSLKKLDGLLIIKLEVSGVEELILTHAFTKKRNKMEPDVDEKELSDQNGNLSQDPNTGDFVFPFPDKPDWCGTPFPDKPDGTVELPNLSATCPFRGVEEPPDWLKNETGWMIETG